jgi:predicted nucleic acid-binding protein
MTMAWIFADEGSERTATLLESLLQDHALVPSLWPMEVANVLLAATRRGRIKQNHWPKLLSHLSALPIHIDDESADHVFDTVLPLAQTHQLSVYDAVYLGLALKKHLPLATLDNRLAAACGTAGVPTL